jgi:hypothetical protein
MALPGLDLSRRGRMLPAMAAFGQGAAIRNAGVRDSWAGPIMEQGLSLAKEVLEREAKRA